MVWIGNYVCIYVKKNGGLGVSIEQKQVKDVDIERMKWDRLMMVYRRILWV